MSREQGCLFSYNVKIEVSHVTTTTTTKIVSKESKKTKKELRLH